MAFGLEDTYVARSPTFALESLMYTRVDLDWDVRSRSPRSSMA